MQFDSESGPSAFIRDIDDPEPIDIFEKIFPKELVQLIVFQTNLYATQSGKSFTPTTDNEIRTFLGINILMGIKRMPAYRDYWSSAPELHDRYIASLMAVNRFGWLLRNIHLNDNTLHPEKGHPGYDKLYKLRPVIKILSESFSKCYQPSKHLAIDESMIKFKGRNSMKQYMRDKPIKRGYKVWMLCDKTSYNLKFDIYTGKPFAQVSTQLSAESYPTGSQIIVLTRGLLSVCAELLQRPFNSVTQTVEELTKSLKDRFHNVEMSIHNVEMSKSIRMRLIQHSVQPPKTFKVAAVASLEEEINLPESFEDLLDFGNELLKPWSQSGEGE
ncbi:piggyBac transposable element-derived protein 3-like [Schistocerca serialis cubense]|uniref:piggyBac transposable element-derived protein 3-like n=1 Tax=Schistocerca serialis cubense TaxID=2023355 RepID=UPI00214F048D|nr:piggyBac transposable element-derived protein 3-like [Schistocerca serialis cubense]